MKKKLRPAVLAACLLSGCASTQMQSVYRAPDFSAAHIHKVLIVGLTSTPQIRKLLEEEFVRQWKERGVEAVASYAVLPSNVPLDKANVASFARTQGFDSVLVNRLLSREAVDRSVHVHEIGQPAQAPADEMMTPYVQAVVASPEYGIPFEVAVLSTTLYDVSTEKKLWSGVSQTLVADDVPKRIRPFTRIILKNLYS